MRDTLLPPSNRNSTAHLRVSQCFQLRPQQGVAHIFGWCRNLGDELRWRLLLGGSENNLGFLMQDTATLVALSPLTPVLSAKVKSIFSRGVKLHNTNPFPYVQHSPSLL